MTRPQGGLGSPGSLTPGWYADAAVVVLATAAALFVVAGVLRLSRWRLLGDAHSVLAGSALLVVGGLGLPLVGIADVAGALQHRALAESLVRAFATFLTIGLVLRAVLPGPHPPVARPSRLLPIAAAYLLVLFAALVALGLRIDGPVPGGPEIARVLSALMVAGWAGLTVAAWKGRRRTSWAGRATPQFALLAGAEAAYGLLGDHPVAVATALVLCGAVAAIAVVSASIDLCEAVQAQEEAVGSLARTARTARGQASALAEWRTALVHDAGNSVAGIRAALGVLDTRSDRLDPSAAKLCHAAVEEARHLEELLFAPTEHCRPFDLGTMVTGVAASERTLGSDVTVLAGHVTAFGRPDDMEAVVGQLLANARRHAPEARVVLSVDHEGDHVRLLCEDDGPGLDPVATSHAFEKGYRGPGSDGAGVGLYRARLLMRAQGGDLTLQPGGPGARFEALLPALAPTSEVPAQRTPPEKGTTSVTRGGTA